MKKIRKRRVLLVFVLFVGIAFLCFTTFYNPKKVVKKDNNKKTKIVKKESNEKIEIKLLGREEVTVVKNGVYEEYGVIATINDKDATDKVKTKGEVDTTKVGNYEITYYIDKTKVIRKVNVIDVTDPDTDGIPVLMYHYFYDDTQGQTGKDANYMAKTRFEEQLKYLSENGYYFPNMKEVKKYVDGELDLPSKSVVLTLDDGEESNYTIAYPLAVQYKVPLYWFIVTSWTDVNNEYQVNIKNSGYVSYLSHTDNLHHGGCGEQHGGALLCVNYEEGVNDLKESVKKLGNSDALAYPCGDSNDNARKIVEDAGISLAFTTEYGKVTKGMNKYNLPRVRMNSGISLTSFINSL